MIGKATEIDLCPWAFLGDDLAKCNRIFDLLRHWRKGQLQLLIPQPSEQIMALIATADQEANCWEGEQIERAQAKAERDRRK